MCVDAWQSCQSHFMWMHINLTWFYNVHLTIRHGWLRCQVSRKQTHEFWGTDRQGGQQQHHLPHHHYHKFSIKISEILSYSFYNLTCNVTGAHPVSLNHHGGWGRNLSQQAVTRWEAGMHTEQVTSRSQITHIINPLKLRGIPHSNCHNVYVLGQWKETG